MCCTRSTGRRGRQINHTMVAPSNRYCCSCGQRVLPAFCERRTALFCQLAYLSGPGSSIPEAAASAFFDSGGFARLLWR